VLPPLFLEGMCLLFGLIIGSFLNVMIARLPMERSIVHPPSACPECGAPIRWYDNIPIVSWLALRARCRACHTPISWRYPAVELLTGLLFAVAAWRAVTVLHLVASMALLGILMGVWSGGAVAIALLATGVKGRKAAIPFGPFLALGGVISLLWGRPLLAWYLGG